MLDFFKRIYFWCYIKVHTILINISIALYRTEEEILKADPNDLQERDKRVQRKLHRNPVLEKFYAGKTDEKYVQEYYEILKKADKFVRNATPREKAIAMNKHLRFDDEKDPYGKRYTDSGFFDEKHKHAGKTVGEVLALELEERRTKDDDLEILTIYDNKPVEVGLADIMDVLVKSDDDSYQSVDIFTKSKTFQFPIKVNREKDCANKIEQLTEFLHVKKIGFEYRQLEFFIPLKFKTQECDENSDIFKELTNIKEVFLRGTYGELIGYGVLKYIKRINYNDTHEVLKFEAIEMENVRINS